MPLHKFLFKAEATALRGAIRKPYYQDLGKHAVVSTHAGSGGTLTAAVQRKNGGNGEPGFAIGKDIFYSHAWSQITAEERDETYITVAETTIRDLSIGGRLMVRKVVCRLQSRYSAAEYEKRKVSRISPRGSTIEGLFVDKAAVQFQLPHAFTMSKAEEESFFKGRYDDDSESKYHPGFFGPSFHKDGFGTLYFGEWSWVHPDERERQHLTMLRMSLGSDFGLEADCCEAYEDGSGWPR